VDRGHGRIDARTIKTLPPTGRISELFPHVRQVFLVERYSYGTDGELLGAVAVLGITSLPPDQAGPGDLLAYLRGHWSITRLAARHRDPYQLLLQFLGLIMPLAPNGNPAVT